MIFLQYYDNGYNEPATREVKLPSILVNFGSKSFSLKRHDYDVEGKAYDEYDLRIHLTSADRIDTDNIPIKIMEGTSTIEVETHEALKKAEKKSFTGENVNEYFNSVIDTEPFYDSFWFGDRRVKLVWKKYGNPN